MIYDGYAKDDWTTYTADTYTVTGDTVINKIDVVTAKVDSKKGSGTSVEVRVDGTWYKVASNLTAADLKTGSTYELAIVGNYIVNFDETEASSTDILFLADYAAVNNSFQSSSTTQDVKAYFMDGSSKTITVESARLDGKPYTDEDYDIKSGSNAISDHDVNRLYTFAVKSNGNYEIELLDSTNKAGYEQTVALKSGSIGANQKIDNLPVDDEAVIFVAYGTNNSRNTVQPNVKVLSGKTVNDWEDAYGTHVVYATKKSNGIEYVKVGAIIDTAEYTGATTDYLYGYMLSDSYEDRNADNEKVTAYEIWTGTEKTTVYADGTGTSKNAGDILAYSKDGDFIKVKTVNEVDVAITGLQKKSEGNVAFTDATGATQTYAMDKDCVYIAVNDDKQEGMEGSALDQISLAEEQTNAAGVATGKYYLNARIVYTGATGSEKIVAIIYDADNNRLDGDPVNA